jgi:hypothetical protein
MSYIEDLITRDEIKRRKTTSLREINYTESWVEWREKVYDNLVFKCYIILTALFLVSGLFITFILYYFDVDSPLLGTILGVIGAVSLFISILMVQGVANIFLTPIFDSIGRWYFKKNIFPEVVRHEITD